MLSKKTIKSPLTERAQISGDLESIRDHIINNKKPKVKTVYDLMKKYSIGEMTQRLHRLINEYSDKPVTQFEVACALRSKVYVRKEFEL